METEEDKKFQEHQKSMMRKFMTKSRVKMFLYVIEAASLPTKDTFSLSDPYLIIKCGDQVVDVNNILI